MDEYRYTECGLDNVFIENLTVRVNEDEEDLIVIPFINVLHRVIASGLVSKTSSINGKELRYLRTEMGMTQVGLAKVVHRESLTVSRWERNEDVIDRNAEVIIRVLATEELNLPTRPTVRQISEWCTAVSEGAPLIIDGFDPPNYRLTDKATIEDTGHHPNLLNRSNAPGPVIGAITPTEASQRTGRSREGGGELPNWNSVLLAAADGSSRPSDPTNDLEPPMELEVLGSVETSQGSARLVSDGQVVFLELPSGSTATHVSISNQPYRLVPVIQESSRFEVQKLSKKAARHFVLNHRDDPDSFSLILA